MNEDFENYFDEDGEFHIKLVRGKPIWTELTLILVEAIRQGELTARVPLSAVQDLYEFSGKTPGLDAIQSEKAKPARKPSVQTKLQATGNASPIFPRKGWGDCRAKQKKC